jgi:hypothetical protein
MKVIEVTTPTPEQQRIKAMQAQVKRAQDAVKAERARQKIKNAQTTKGGNRESPIRPERIDRTPVLATM